MDLFTNLATGFGTALKLTNLAYAFVGCLLGTLIGVLPGLGPLTTIAMLLPITYALSPDAALIMLAGIYYGAQYGGSTTAIVVNLPGESSSVVTTIDGYQMARKGRAGVALSTAAIGSFFAGCVATLAIAALAAPLASVALQFGPKEYFSLMILGLLLATVLSNGPFIEGVAMILFGTLLSLTGTDVNTGTQRFAFDIPQLFDGLDFVPLAMGIFGFAEIVKNLEPHEERTVMTQKITNMFPTREDFKRMIPAIMRGTTLGTCLGVLPGGGSVLSAFAAYTVEKKLSKHPEEFGKGAIEGVAGPESANNAGAQTSFIPLLTLGLPSNVVMALMVGAMTIHNIQPGPQVMTKNPELFWGLIASMWVGNLMLVILNLPLVGLWVKLLTIPYRYLYPAIMVFCCIGVYSLKNDTFEVYEAALFCIFGYLLIKLQLPPAPMLLGLVLGPQIEENFRRAMLLSRGDVSVFVTSPLSATLLGIAVIAVILITLPQIRSTRQEALKE
ncbi:tripartite tricarboxylate transporter permease [Bradyrhizobium sp. LHD-71]|uniref:tripartite tricarboxylate transporter permease n=1 Tax=Bradyrhizobium sp. LHD-71 TaxID=3072141 RepID=UPI00280F2C47|nr:tripartite tricarboxylate transporter permease [Bradyrhizobium sp. LHD-71]MDQ8726225.1 tripartite tricarboxylate transporter permease [Bradyrhizobium sp. LHD-71]